MSPTPLGALPLDPTILRPYCVEVGRLPSNARIGRNTVPKGSYMLHDGPMETNSFEGLFSEGTWRAGVCSKDLPPET